MKADTDTSSNTETKSPRRQKRSGTKAARKTGQTRRASGTRGRGRGRARNGNGNGNGYSVSATRLLSQGREALGGAYEWAADGATRAGRALPRVADRMPDQSAVQNFIEERPLILGAIGLGIGAMIGMMLPSRLMSMGSSDRSSGTRRGQRRGGRKSS